MAYTKVGPFVNGQAPALSAANLNTMDQGIYDAHNVVAQGRPGSVRYLSEFAGANDDAKLTAFMSYAAAQTYKGITVILDENRLYTFSTGQNLYDGFSIQGSARPQDQARGSKPLGQQVNMRMSGGWFNLTQSSTFGCSFQGLSLDGTSSNRLVSGHASNVLWTSVFRDISCQNAANVLGSVATKLLITACTVDGWWNVNNVQERAFNFGGSDFYFSPSMLLLDSPPALMPDNGYLMSLSNLSNTWISNIYCTADSHSGLRIDSGTSDDAVWIKNCVWEGRNNTEYSAGALIRQSGGQTILRDNRFAYAMANPSLSGLNDLGVIHVSGGKMLVDGCTYRKQSSVAETVPLIYVTGASTRVVVRNIVANGTWTGLPRVQQSQSGLIDADSSVTVVTG